MTQPAKVQEPSMEEILASIRRIIADDEAKPPAAEKPASPVAAVPSRKSPPRRARRQGARDERHSAVGHSGRARLLRQRPRRRRPAAPPPARRRRSCSRRATNSQDDIDALLAGLDEATSGAEIRPPLPEKPRCSSSPTRWRCAPAAPAAFVPQGRTAGRSRIRRSRRGQGAAPAAGVRTTAVRKPGRPRRLSRSCRTRPCPRSNPPSTASPIRC